MDYKESKENMDRCDLLDRLSRARKEQAGVCTSTCRSIVYSVMAAVWAFWIKDGLINDGVLITVFALSCLYLIFETCFCYYVAKQANNYYNRARITIIPTKDIEENMKHISDISFRKLLFQIIFCGCIILLFGYYVLNM